MWTNFGSEGDMSVQLITLGVLVAVFAVATWRSVHMGALALAAALLVGTTIAGESIDEILASFPVDILLLLLGITLLFGIARSNGALEWLVTKAVRVMGQRTAAMPVLFFLLAAGIASLGSPLAAILLKPFAVSFALQRRMSPAVLVLAGATGASSGAFAPTSLFGLLTVRIAQNNGIELNPMVLFGSALGINVILCVAACWIFRKTLVDVSAPAVGDGGRPSHSSGPFSGEGGGQAAIGRAGGVATAVAPTVTPPQDLSRYQKATIFCVASMVITVVGLSVAGTTLDVGAVSLGLAMVLSLVFSKETASAIREVDWSTILLVGGIVTYVSILDRLGAIDTVANLGVQMPVPLLAAFLLCLSAAAISSVGSTTGLLPIIVPLAIPLATAGTLPAAGVVCALALSASLVDVSPFSTSGAASVSAAPEYLRPGLKSMLLRWAMAMIIVGPVLTCGLLIVPWM